MTTAKTPAQRQADRKAREIAAGRVQWKRWVHPDDVPALVNLADKLARKRERNQPSTRSTGLRLIMHLDRLITRNQESS